MSVRPAFGAMNASLAKTLATNAPKYQKIIEPFGDAGSFAFYLAKRKPKEHLLNVEDETLFNLLTFVQKMSSSHKAQLKRFDWISSKETFEKALAIKATEGPELFYRFIYLKKFGERATDPESDPVYDWLTVEEDTSSVLFSLPIMRSALKVVVLSLGPGLKMITGGDAKTFWVLLPKKPEDVEGVRSRIKTLGSPFFFGAKINTNEQIVEAVKQYPNLKVNAMTASSIMMGKMITVWNYDTRLEPLDPKVIGEVSGK